MTSRKQDALVRMRNCKVTLALRRKYQGVTPEACNLRINCVSNLHYEHHVNGYNRDFLPLPIETTGIPALRTELLALPAPGKLSALQHHWNGRLMGTIASMNNYSCQTVNQRQEKLKLVVQQSYEVREISILYLTHQLTRWPQDLRGRHCRLRQNSGGLSGRKYSPRNWYLSSNIFRGSHLTSKQSNVRKIGKPTGYDLRRTGHR